MENLIIEKECLLALKKNERAIISGIDGGCNARNRLFELGLNKGVSVEILKNDIGPLILSIQGHKLAIGKGLASKIIIEQ